MSLEMDRARPAALAPEAREGAIAALRRRAADLGDVGAAPCLYAALLALMTLPVLIWPIPRAADIVNHWARLTLIGMSPADPLNALYQVKFVIIPNLGIDLLYLALSPLLSAASVARLGWALAFLLPAWGAWRLHRALFSKPQLAILLVPLLSYNLVVTTGLVSYGLGMGVALLALAWRVGSERKRFWRGVVVLNLVSIVLLFSHVLALLAFCVAFGLWEATPKRGEAWRASLPRGLIAPLHVAAGLVLLALAERTPGGFDLVGHKWQVFTAPFYAMTQFDLAFGAAIVGLLIAARLAGLLSVAPGMGWALAGLGAFILLMPSAWGAGNLLDARLAVFWAYLAVASLSWEWTGRPARLVAALLVVLGLARVASVAPGWMAFEAAAASVRDAFAAIPPGARVLVVRPPGDVCSDPDLPMLNNLSAFAVIDRRAMVNTLFADSGMQPVRPRDAAMAAAPKMAMSSSWLSPEGRAPLGKLADAEWAQPYVHWREHFDTIVAMHGKCDGKLDEPGLERVSASAAADVYRVR
jgi:hypothetical protein